MKKLLDLFPGKKTWSGLVLIILGFALDAFGLGEAKPLLSGVASWWQAHGPAVLELVGIVTAIWGLIMKRVSGRELTPGKFA